MLEAKFRDNLLASLSEAGDELVKGFSPNVASNIKLLWVN